MWALVLISVLATLAGIDLGHRLLPNAILNPAAVFGQVLSVAGDAPRWWVSLEGVPNSVLRDRGKLFALALAFRGGMGMFRTPGTAVPEMAVPVSPRMPIAVAPSTSYNSGGDLALPKP